MSHLQRCVPQAALNFGLALFWVCAIFGSPDHDIELGGEDMAPLEHHLASGLLSSPHPSLEVTQAASGMQRLVCTVPCTAGSANAPIRDLHSLRLVAFVKLPIKVGRAGTAGSLMPMCR